MGKAEPGKGVEMRGRADMRDAPSVAAQIDLSGQSRHRHRAVEVRQMTFRSRVDSPCCHDAVRSEGCNQTLPAHSSLFGDVSSSDKSRNSSHWNISYIQDDCDRRAGQCTDKPTPHDLIALLASGIPDACCLRHLP